MLPVLLMLLFGGAIATGTSYVSYVVPGVLLLCAGFGVASTAVTVCQDMTGGIVDRLRSLDVPAPVFLTGHVVASLVRNVVSTALVLGVAFLIGLLRGTPAGASPWHALAWCGGILLASVAVSGDAFRHRMTGCCDERNSGVPVPPPEPPPPATSAHGSANAAASASYPNELVAPARPGRSAAPTPCTEQWRCSDLCRAGSGIVTRTVRVKLPVSCRLSSWRPACGGGSSACIGRARPARE